MFPQVGKEIADRPGHIGPQLGMSRQLVEMGVKAAVLGIENLRSQVSQMNLRHAPQAFGNGIVGVFHAGGILCRGGFDDVRALEGVPAGLPQVIHHRAAADGRRIDPGKEFQHPLPFRRAAEGRHIGKDAVGSQVGYRSNRHPAQGHRPRQPLPEVDALQHILPRRIQIPDDPAQPALGADLLRLAGMPDVHRAEVGTGGVFVADAVDNRQVALLPQVFDRPHAGMKAQLVGEPDDVPLRDTQVGAVIPIAGFGERNHRVEIVVGAGKLQDHQRRVFSGSYHQVASCIGLALRAITRLG